MKRKRTLIITLLSVFLIFVGGGTFLLHLFHADFSKESLDLVSSQCGITGYVSRHFGLAGLRVGLAAIGFVLATVGIGLWRLLPWARTALIFLSCIEICSVVEQMVEMHVAHTCGYVDMIAALAGIFFLFYCSRPKIKNIFAPGTVLNETSAV